MRTGSIVAFCSFAVLSTGCATIVASGPDMVPVSSTPFGATVYVDNIPVGVTPTTVSLKRSGFGHLRIEMPGYEPVALSQEKVFNGWFVGNIALGGIIGIVVDIATSNVTKFSEAPVMVQLRAVHANGEKSEPVAVEMIPVS